MRISHRRLTSRSSISKNRKKTRHLDKGQPKRKPRFSPRLRILIVWSILFIAVVGLLGRLAQLQLHRGDALTAIAQQQQARKTSPSLARIPIIDSQGTPLAVDRLVYTLYAHPVLFRQPMGIVASTLAPLLKTPAETLTQHFKEQETGVRLLDNIPEDIAQRIRRLRLDGVELMPHQQRFYPQQDLFSQIVGFINLEGKAQAGLEMAYQEHLNLPKTALPQVTGPALPVAYLPTEHHLQLQVNPGIAVYKRVAQEALRQTMRQFGAKRGTVIVMDVNTGALRSFAVETHI